MLVFLVPRVVALVLLAALGVTVFRLATDGNNFPDYYHPDEGSKVDQARNPTNLNFNHPLLLIEASHQIAKWKGLPLNGLFIRASDERVLACGRLASAMFVTAGAIAVALAGYRLGGLLGLIGAGALYSLSPQLILYGHYMKEDGPLALGLSLVILAITLLLTNRRWYARYFYCGFLGLAVAMAFSGKAAGALSAIPAVVALIFTPVPDFKRWSLKTIDALPRMVLFVVMAALTVVTVNHRAFTFKDPLYAGLPTVRASAQGGIEREIDHATTGHSGVALVSPNTYFLRTAVELTPPAAFVMLAVVGATLGVFSLVGIGRFFDRRSAAKKALSLPQTEAAIITPTADSPIPTASPTPAPSPVTKAYPPLQLPLMATLVILIGVFAVALSYYNTIPFKRYSLPIVLGLHALAALGTAVVFRRLYAVRPAKGFWPSGLQCLLIVIAMSLVGLAIPRALDIPRQFHNDSRVQVRSFLAALPPGTRLIADGYVSARTQVQPLIPRTIAVSSVSFVGQAGSPEELARQGFKYAVLCELNYDRFTDPDIRSTYDRSRFERTRQNYNALLALPAEWESDMRHPTRSFTNPHIKVVRLPDVPRPGK